MVASGVATSHSPVLLALTTVPRGGTLPKASVTRTTKLPGTIGSTAGSNNTAAASSTVTIRELASLPVRAWSYEQHAIVGTVEVAGSHADTCYQAFLSTGPLALLPLADKTACSIVWSLDNDIWETLMNASDEDFVAQMNRAIGPNCPEVLAVGPRAAFPLHQCHAVDYVAERIALVGDAAHAIHPLAGQGINLGLKDVAALAGELEQVWSSGMDIGSPDPLKRFQRVRKADNLAMMAAMEGFKRGFGSANPAVRVLRNLGLNWVNQAGWLRDWFARHAVS